MSYEMKGWISSVLFIGAIPSHTYRLFIYLCSRHDRPFIAIAGMLAGGYIWGTLGDIYGRRRVLMSALMLTALAGIVASFSQEYVMFLIARLVGGLGIGGTVPVVWSYFAEFQPCSSRGRMLR